MVVGDGRPFIGALVTLDPEGLASWLPTIGQPADLSLADAAALPQVREEIQPFVDRANATVSRAESVRKFVVLDAQFTQKNSCLTPSLKVVRPAVNRVFSGADRPGAVRRQALTTGPHTERGVVRTCRLAH